MNRVRLVFLMVLLYAFKLSRRGFRSELSSKPRTHGTEYHTSAQSSMYCTESRDDCKYFSKSILWEQNELICVNRRACFALVRALNMAWLVYTPQGILPLAALRAESLNIAEAHTRFTQVQLNQSPKTKLLAFPVIVSHLISSNSS